jgi:hypothetical protein
MESQASEILARESKLRDDSKTWRCEILEFRRREMLLCESKLMFRCATAWCANPLRCPISLWTSSMDFMVHCRWLHDQLPMMPMSFSFR